MGVAKILILRAVQTGRHYVVYSLLLNFVDF